MENFLTQVMTSHGYLALIIFAFIEACCIPISSEITFAFAGVIAFEHPDKFTIAAVIIIGTIAELAGSLTLAYAIGRRGGRHLLEQYGKWVLISHSDLDRAERFFAGRGSWAVAVARALPLVRCFAGFGAGVVEVPMLPFAIFNLIGTAGLDDRADAARLQPRLDRGQVLQDVLGRRHHPGRRAAWRADRPPGARDQEGRPPPRCRRTPAPCAAGTASAGTASATADRHRRPVRPVRPAPSRHGQRQPVRPGRRSAPQRPPPGALSPG